MSRTTLTTTNSAFIVDKHWLPNITRAIDWANVPASFEDANGTKIIPAGTIMAEMASGDLVPRSAVPGAETATCILASTATNHSKTGARAQACFVGGIFYDNIMPDRDDASLATYKTELASAGVGFLWETYSETIT